MLRLQVPEREMPACYAREPEGAHPRLNEPSYKSTALRHPREPLVLLAHTMTEVSGPRLGSLSGISPVDSDLTRQHPGPPIGERILVSGQVLDTEGRPLPATLVEIWQANAAGRYLHPWDNWAAPLDPHFSGAGRCVTDSEGRYSFTTIKPGPYPWGNHYNAWRPAHIHFSLLGRAFAQRLVTQMYFPGDPLCRHDPIFNSVRDRELRERMIATFSIRDCRPDWATAYRFDLVLRGPGLTPLTEAE